MPTFTLGILLVLATAFREALAAATPPQFKPTVHRVVQVHYGNFKANPPGKAMRAGYANKAPDLGIQEPDLSTGYTAIMLDISVHTDQNPKNTTRLHWIQTELKTENKTKSLDTNVPPVVPYYAPGPPKDETHTFVVLMYKQPPGWTVPSEYVDVFAKTAGDVASRSDFDLEKFTTAAKFDKPAAADYFLISTNSQTSKEGGTAPTPITTSSPAPTQKSGVEEGRKLRAWEMTWMIGVSCLAVVLAL